MVACISILIVGTIITPVFATRYINLEKKVDVRKELFAETLIDLRNYAKIFPSFIKSVELKSDNNAKFRVNVEGTSYDAEVRYTIQPDHKYVLEVVSGDLKGTKMITTLTETWGFDGTPNAGTIVNMKVTLETSWFVSFIMFFVGDHQIRSALDTGVYLLAEHAKKLPVQVSSQNTETKNIEAARKLEPEKEALKSKSQDSGYQVVGEEAKSNLEKQLEIAKKKGKQAEIEIKKEKPSQSILVSTDRVSYADGETIVVFGKVSEYVPNVQATIVITNPISQRVYLEQVEVGTDKTYSTEITAGGSLWKNAGTYTIVVQYGTAQQDDTTFSFSGPSITVSTDKTSYSDSDTIIISGSVKYVVEGTPLTYQILDPTKNQVQIGQIDVAQDGKYITTIKSGALWEKDGTYTVIVQYGLPNVVAETTFSFSGSTGTLGDEHEHAAMNVIIFGDKFDFSTNTYQVKNMYIHFENHNGETIHRHASGVTMGFLFETLNIGFTDKCFIFPDKREFCTNNDYSLKLYVNHLKVPSLSNYVLQDDDRILISYGNENSMQIKAQLASVDSII